MSSSQETSSSSSNSSSQNSDYVVPPPLHAGFMPWQNENVCVKVLENMNLAKLSLDSPRNSPSRSPLMCMVNMTGRSLLRRNTGTPEKVTPSRSMKRKCETALDLGEGTPKSSKDPRMSASPANRSPYLRAKRLESPKASGSGVGSQKPPKGIAFTRQKITHEFDLAEGMADGVSETIADLFSKPIKSAPYTSTVVDDEGYPKSSEWAKENSSPSIAARNEQVKRHAGFLEGEGGSQKEAKRARPSPEVVESRPRQALKNLNGNREFSFSIPTSPIGASDRLGRTYRAQSNDMSENVKIAVERIGSDSSLIGDGSKRYLLPVLPEEERKHQDLQEISGDTLVKLLDGKFRETVDSFAVVDCRYPYEYHGGHIKSAINLYTEKAIHEHFILYLNDTEKQRFKRQRHIVIFHCEFSSQRGPSMCRYLRRTDRNVNEYPSLFYPELYVLNGGYKDFFEKFQSHCNPGTYLPMVHSNYSEEYRFYKAQSKTEVVDNKNSKSKLPPAKAKSFRQASMKKLELGEDD